jgi:transposase
MKGILTMSVKERERLKIIDQVIERKLSTGEAAEVLEISTRQMYRIKGRYYNEGEKGLIHKLRGKSSNRGYGKKQKESVIKLYVKDYSDYGPTLFSEKLLEYHGQKIDHETIRRWLRESAITTSMRKKRPHRRKRERRTAIGEMIQFDGSPHDWFEGRGAMCCLLHAIDDASGRIYLRFAASENTSDCLLTLKKYCQKHGIPKAIYTDHGSVFYADGKLTDVGLAMEKLGVEMIYANSPQAKGRVERGNRTHQDRLVKELRKENISTIAEANKYLEEKYLYEHNRRFSMCDNLADVHRSIEGYDLNNIFCYQTERQVKNDYTITLGARYIQLSLQSRLGRNATPLPLPKRYVTVRRWLDDSLHIFYKEQELSFIILKDKPKTKNNVVRKPKADHPWKKWNIGRGKKFRGIPILRIPEVTPVGLRPPSVTSGITLT